MPLSRRLGTNIPPLPANRLEFSEVLLVLHSGSITHCELCKATVLSLYLNPLGRSYFQPCTFLLFVQLLSGALKSSLTEVSVLHALTNVHCGGLHENGPHSIVCLRA